MQDFNSFKDKEGNISLEKASLLLALTESRTEEDELRRLLTHKYSLVCGVTEIGGTVTTLQGNGKLINAVLSAAFNTNVIHKEPTHIHAVVHATLEASNSIFIHTNSNASFALKVGMVTDQKWLAIAIFGWSSLHPLSEHGRVGLGYMHL